MSDLMLRAYGRLITALSREDGQAVTEYAVVLVLIAAISAVLLKAGIDTTLVKKITDQLAAI